jgi:putative transposase
MAQSYRHKNTSVTLINYHFVWCPRRRKKVLKGLVESRLKELIYQSCSEIDVVVVALEVMPDHVHAFLNCPPTISPSQIMHKIKGYTARYLRQEFTELLTLPSMWTRSYFCSTAGNVSSATVERYIAQQKTRG